ncbi:uroporphyrinogen-III C-methyltransferase [Marinoscillum furvescens]|nr:uroporphyrinogen-III C-methyltransferase [Marinoscillum furvescens]
MSKTPKLTLVGAGPGDPELITLKGLKALQAADVVLYDALVDPELLTYAPDALHIPVGKRAGKSSVSQDTINSLIVQYAKEHGHVVRLKGGDPFVFGRGFEEKAFAEQHGLEVDVVVGVSSVMLPGYFGIPLTCRGINQSFTVVTATTREGKLSDEVLNAAAYAPTTLFFMGLGKLDMIAEAYVQNGRGELPVAIVSKGSHKDGEVIKGTANTIAEVAAKKQPEAPALLVFGEGAALASNEQQVNQWWETVKTEVA